MKTKTQFGQLGLFDTKVPRYSSYPTASHFSDQVGSGQMRDWLRAVPVGGQVSLYVHIPFCKRLCWFCAYRTQGTTTAAPVASYLETLSAEIDLLAENLPDGVTLNRLHWGGGTPTLLSAEMIDGLARKINQTIPFGPGAEFSVEIDPNEIDARRLDALVAAGMSRATIGMQDFDPHVQSVIGRNQSYAVTADAVDLVRAAGVHNVNANILFGLPHQTPERMTDSISKLLSLTPDRVALYGYAHVPWKARRQSLIPSAALPTPEERLTLFDAAQKLLEWDGYQQIGTDHFARPGDSLTKAQAAGTLRRNFQGYTDDQSDTLIGLGASAISRFAQGYAQNTPATSRYVGAVRAGSFATDRGHVFGGDDLLRSQMIDRIMCDFEVSASDFGADAGTALDWMRSADQAFDGALVFKNGTLRIPTASRALTRMVARHFDAYAAKEGRHASAI